MTFRAYSRRLLLEKLRAASFNNTYKLEASSGEL